MRALGYIPDVADPRDRSLGRFLAYGEGVQRTASAKTIALPKPSHRHLRGERIYQGAASSCVAFAESRCIHISHQLQLEPGEPIPERPAPRFMYAIGRLQEFAGLDPNALRPPIQDEGMMPRLGLAGVRNVGFVAESRYPYTDEKRAINATPKPPIWTAAHDQRGLDYFRVFEHDVSRSAAVAAGMMKGITFEVGMVVDKAFGDHDGKTPIDFIDPTEIEGGHMMAVLEVLPNGDVVVDNWWHEWGDDGVGIISARLFGSSRVTGIYGIRWVPNYSEEGAGQ